MTAPVLSSLYYSALRRTGLTALARRLRAGALILCYHNVVPSHGAATGDPAIHLPVDRFTGQLHWLRERYTVVPLLELATRIAKAATVRGLAAITFDDGYTGTFAHAWPVLRELRLPATVFIVAQAPGRPEAFWWDHPVIAAATTPDRRDQWLTDLRGDATLISGALGAGAGAPPPGTHLPATWSVVAAAAAAGLDVGVHSATHRTLTRLDDTELEREIKTAAEVVYARTRTEPTTFSYPYGIWDARVRRSVREAGYRAAVTLDYGLNTPSADLWSLRRINVPASISQSALAGWAAGVRPSRSPTSSALRGPAR
ncbi:MAG: hypothetical protein DMD29_07380 [Gemmatimonadetes bacterium]|nr:MAG: hypothetical protein DMD29_07380 [Gemmatimonadota bacterium]